MRRLFSVGVLLPAITAFMSLVLIVGCSAWAVSAARRLAIADQTEFTTGVSADLFVAMQQLRLERGGVSVALAGREPLPATSWAYARSWRETAGHAVDSALRKLSRPGAGLAPGELDAQIAQIRARQAAVEKLRREAYAAVRDPKGPRREALRHDWIVAETELVQSLHDLSHRLTSRTAPSDPFITSMFLVRHAVWTTRDAAGDDLLLLGEAVAEGRKLTLDERARFATLEGRVEAGWSPVEEQVSGAGVPPRLRQAAVTAETYYRT
ncbi:MAG TPA: hypothetical protein VFH92_07170, partial [Phenylobacterium sp.]|nr:hypothetical protein [Phenylobacterium sp.]